MSLNPGLWPPKEYYPEQSQQLTVKSFSPQALLPVYGVGVLGAFLQIAGAQWDVSAHILGIVETFFTPAHAVLYAGIGLVALANLQGVRLRLAHGQDSQYASLFSGLRIAVVGTELQIIAAPIDFYWHSVYGFDPFLFTPAHSILIVGVVFGGIGMTLGAIRLFQAQRLGQQVTARPWILTALVMLGLAAMWGQFNFFGYWITDLSGMAYTFGICGIEVFRSFTRCEFVSQFRLVSELVSFGLFSATGTFFFWTSKKLFRRPGLATLTAAILVAVYAVLAIGFMVYAMAFLNPPGSFYLRDPSPQTGSSLAGLIPVYLLALIPIFLLDVGVRNSIQKRTLVLLSALVGPFAAFIDARYTIGIVGSDLSVLLVVAILTVVGGLLGGLLITRLGSRLSIYAEAWKMNLKTSPLIPVKSVDQEGKPIGPP